MFVSKFKIQFILVAIVLVYFIFSLGLWQILSGSWRPKFSWETEDFGLNDLIHLSKSNTIPPVLHQSWKSAELPSSFQYMANTWKSTNPDLKLILWTDKDNDLFMRSYFPQFYSTWAAFDLAIYRIDAIRYLYLLKFGGIYADLDTISFKPILPLLTPHSSSAILAKISDDDSWLHNVPNAWMASKPQNKFWVHVWNSILKKMESSSDRGAEALTGPVLLLEASESYKGDIKVLPPGLVYGVDWRNSTRVCADARSDTALIPACAREFPDIYVLTLWTHSWE